MVDILSFDHKASDIKDKNESFITIPGFSEFPELVHGFTTRFGGVSTDEYASLNLNYNKNDDKGNVRKNFEILGKKLNVKLDRMVLSHQVHGKNILQVQRSHGGMGIIRERDYSNIDALITNEKDLLLITHYADCVPLYFYDPVKKVIALAHSGWKSTLLNIGVETLQILKESYGCNSSDIYIAFGPHIQQCCFEVDYDVANKFMTTFSCAKNFIYQKENMKWHIDLKNIIMYNLVEKGICINNILGCQTCTKCYKNIFFSHRGSNGMTGTGAAFLMIRG